MSLDPTSWIAPERDTWLLHSELDACRVEIARLRGNAVRDERLIDSLRDERDTWRIRCELSTERLTERVKDAEGGLRRLWSLIFRVQEVV